MQVIAQYWNPDLHPAIVITVGLIGIAAVQLYSVRWFGEIEFWVSIGKIILLVGLGFYTLITMAGGNPLHDKFGWRYWRNPAAIVGDTPALRLQAVFSGIIWAVFA